MVNTQHLTPNTQNRSSSPSGFHPDRCPPLRLQETRRAPLVREDFQIAGTPEDGSRLAWLEAIIALLQAMHRPASDRDRDPPFREIGRAHV